MRTKLLVALVASTLAIAGTLVAGAPAEAAGADAAPGTFVYLDPVRILDTGSGLGAPRAAVAAGATLSFQVTGVGGVPGSGAGAVALNLTVASETRSGYVTAYPAGATRPPTSSLNHAAGQSIANHVVVKVGTGGKVSLYNGSSGTVRLIADVAGYYLDGSAADPGAFQSVTPARILDTGAGVGSPAGAVAAGATVTFQVSGRGGVPGSGVGAVALNLTVASETATGYVTAYPAGGTRPGTSSLNHAATQSIANYVVVKLGSGGQVSLYNGSSGTVRLVADVAGYVVDGATTDPGSLQALAPARILDTGAGVGAPQAAVKAKATVTFQVTGRGGIPASGVGAVALNLTVASETRSGYVTAFPAGNLRPSTSSLNHEAGQSIANHVVVKVGSGGKVSLYNGSSGTVRLVADVAGYYHARPSSLTWSGPDDVLPDGTEMNQLACASSTFCLTTSSDGLAFSYNGSTWSPAAADPGNWVPYLSCPSATRCIGTTQDGLVQTFDGSTWSSATNVGSALFQLDCPTTTFCLAVGDGFFYLYNGTSWTKSMSDTGVRALSCPTATFCMTLTDEGKARALVNGVWGPLVPTPATPDAFESPHLSCVSSTFCLATGGSVADATYNGTSWTKITGTFPVSLASDVDCVSSTFCLAVNDSSYATYAGSTWSVNTVENGTGLGVQVECFSTTSCIAVAGDGYTSTWNGSSFTTPAALHPDTGFISSASCSSASFCVATTTTGWAVTRTGSGWGSPVAAAPRAPIVVVQCPADGHCVAIDVQNRTYVLDSGTWSPAATAPDFVEDLSCPTSTFCMAVGFGKAFSFDGSTWSAETTLAGNGADKVSCSSATFCVGVGVTATGNASYTFNGSWSTAKVMPQGGVLGVSCAAPTFCTALGDFGETTYDGTTWSPESGPGALSAVDCPAVGVCVALGEAGPPINDNVAYTQVDGVWSDPAVLPIGSPTGSLTCPTTDFCLGFDPLGANQLWTGSS